jgi:hypothetical protein
LSGKGFVQFDHRDIFQLQSGKFQRFGNGVHRADAELFGETTGGGVSDKTCERL